FQNAKVQLLYSTYIGGEIGDQAHGIVTDSDNCAYVVGFTVSYDYPVTSGAYDTIYNGLQDVVVTKLNADGSDLVYSTFIGGTNVDMGAGIAIDREKHVYIIGQTSSPEFPTTPGSYDRIPNGDADCFALKLNNDGSELLFSTLIGGSNADRVDDLLIDQGLNLYFVGPTFSEDFPTTEGCYDDTHNGERDGFICKLNSEGSELLLSTYLGGSEYDYCLGIEIDAMNNVWITGNSESSDFPTTPDCYDDTHNGMMDGIICKFDENLSTLIYSTYIGGSESEVGYSITLDDKNNPLMAGYTSSGDFPTTPGCYDDEKSDEQDGFFLKFDIENSTLFYSTFFGGSHSDVQASMVRKPNDDVILVGTTESFDFPTTPGCYDDTFNGVIDAYVISFNPNLKDFLPTLALISPGNNSEVSSVVLITGTASDENSSIERVEISIDGGVWQNVTGTISWSFEWDTKEVENGEHTIRVRSYDGEDYSEEVSITVLVDNEDDGSDDEWYEEPIYLGGIAAAIIVVAVVVSFTIKKRRAEEGDEDWEEEFTDE
ncbi:MAG: SBBP repeat-containing protein, partial [Thermoplasmata archaeon]|nr:SBBP repeat-containing protein [Thermoplasmata archaeon]